CWVQFLSPSAQAEVFQFESVKFLQRQLFRSLEDWEVSSLKFMQRYGYIRNHKKTVKNGQARTRERKSEQKPEAKPGKVKPSVKVVKSWSTKVNKTQNIPFEPLNFQKNP
ncbi:hypothetical protein Tco_0454780, partial [Tanacetum coccineum]